MLDSIFEPGVTGISPFAIIVSLYLAYYVHNDARNHNNPRALLWAIATFMAWIIFFPLYWFKNMRGRKQ